MFESYPKVLLGSMFVRHGVMWNACLMRDWRVRFMNRTWNKVVVLQLKILVTNGTEYLNT